MTDDADSQSAQEPERASGIQKAANFASAMSRFVASGFETVTQEAYDMRVAKCVECKYHQDTICAICGCYIDKKAWLPYEDCPVGKWPV